MANSLFLLRHAKSSWKNTEISDFFRPLNKRGRNGARLIGQYMDKNQFIPDLVLCSAANRAIETISIIESCMPNKLKTYFLIDLYLASEATILNKIVQIDVPANSVLLVGHNPGIEAFFARLMSDFSINLKNQKIKKYPTGALSIFKVAAKKWADFNNKSVIFHDFVTPKSLKQENFTENNDN